MRLFRSSLVMIAAKPQPRAIAGRMMESAEPVPSAGSSRSFTANSRISRIASQKYGIATPSTETPVATLSMMPPGRTPATMPSGTPTPIATTSAAIVRLIV